MSDDANNLLRTSGLHKHYRMGGHDLHVLRGIDIAVHHGEWLAILGASGSGKSTLLHLLGALDRPDKGEVWFNGQNIYKLRGGQLDLYRNTHVGFVFQFYHLLPELSALDNVLIAARIRHGYFSWLKAKTAMRERAIALFERFDLAHRLKHKPSKLSGGERQRVAIARALINEPVVLLADEPTGNLDSRTGGKLMDVFHQLHAGGQTIVMVTHDQAIAKLAQRRLHLEEGRLQ